MGGFTRYGYRAWRDGVDGFGMELLEGWNHGFLLLYPQLFYTLHKIDFISNPHVPSCALVSYLPRSRSFRLVL